MRLSLMTIDELCLAGDRQAEIAMKELSAMRQYFDTKGIAIGEYHGDTDSITIRLGFEEIEAY